MAFLQTEVKQITAASAAIKFKPIVSLSANINVTVTKLMKLAWGTCDCA